MDDETKKKLEGKVPGMAAAIDKALQTITGEDVPFLLVLTDGNHGGQIQHISNMELSDTLEVINRLVPILETIEAGSTGGETPPTTNHLH